MRHAPTRRGLVDLGRANPTEGAPDPNGGPRRRNRRALPSCRQGLLMPGVGLPWFAIAGGT